ncbi:tyrosine-type recombinase/integrase [Cupriavidus pinatubonensis]|uniref:Prophage integrase IntA n=1 Tax=Cupriavidus pinatubonensis TaxID=248026 RepID=A0ABM8WL70_9BURK|nr:tyrosine-type recombinase/integrase [Cupriavidus pinatubonensis]CAG9168104.1 Prophage integrase IntA [Cupriavidus pinatubonensis]
MPKQVTPLTDTRIKALKPKPARYPVSDGGGLLLEVMPSGSKIWRFRYSLHGKRQPTVTIGDYPAISLQLARDRARKYTEIVAQGVSPVADARQDRGAERISDTVSDFATIWLAAEIEGKSESYSRTTRRALDKDVLPAIGNKRLADVTPGDVLAICDKIKGRGSPKMALTTRNVIKRLYEFAIARQGATINPAQSVAARFIATQESRTRVLAPDEIGTMLRAVYASNVRRPLKLALHLLVLTMVRKSELIEARWEQFDLDAAIWRIPADAMKMRKEHWVYLSTQAVEMLRELREIGGATYVFPSSRGRIEAPIAKPTLNTAVKSLGLEMEHFVLHDFRRTASTHLHEMGLPSDAIEKALAHQIKGIKGVYNRAEYAEERKRILQHWAEFVGAQIDEGRKVVLGQFGKAA